MSSTVAKADPAWAVKRFLERLKGDGELRARCEARPDALERIAREEGLTVDPSALTGFWSYEASDENLEKARSIPELQDWRERLQSRFDYVASMIAMPDQETSVYSRWRRRQRARCEIELPSALNKGLPHITTAIELSSGCSVGCWFCGISAEKYQGSLAYDAAGEALFRGVLEALRDVVGRGLGAASLYWGTDPTDNHDYLKFAETFHAFTGCLPQTTTARPTKDIEWTRQMLSLRRRLNAPGVDRFSLLSTKELHLVHENFTAEELADVELVYHNKGAVGDDTMRARAGKAKKRAETSKRPIALNEDQGTIACVSGFLVNLVEKRVRLISPCAASDDWPDGYRIYAEATFESPDHLRALLTRWTNEVLAADPLDLPVLGFHRAAEVGLLETGFVLESKTKKRRIEGAPEIRFVGEVLAERRWSRQQILERGQERGFALLTLISILGQLRDLGMIDEDPKSR
ncbi:MAG: radical SAM family RiPP maturation amino acid epimerase [Planctomycetota bacterium]